VEREMEDIEFRIMINCPVALTAEAAGNVEAQIKPKWRITRIALQRLGPNVFECKVGIDARDVSQENHADLIAFRDTFLSLLAVIALVPVRPLMKGTFTFPMRNNRYAQLSLGPMDHTFPEKPILSFRPMIEGFGFDEAYRSAIWFIWQAINSSEPVHRFVNLAISYELIVGQDSPVNGSRPPRCSLCGTDIGQCPKCQGEVKVRFTLRERAKFVFAQRELLDDFIYFRNRTFHGGVAEVIAKNSRDLAKLNTALLVNIRNYFGQKLGLKEIDSSEIGRAVDVPDIIMTVFFETKS
jgi:hypothetical protein